jgi:hypothetical protein
MIEEVLRARAMGGTSPKKNKIKIFITFPNVA